jgi:hypothetical protein
MRYTIVMLGLIAVGCSDAEAEKVRQVGEKTYDRAATLVLNTWDELGKTLLEPAPVSKPEFDVASKVRYRLQWDKDLEGQGITVTLVDEGLQLTGKVATKEQKERAQQLAEQTLGVVQVKNELELEIPANTEKPTTPSAPSVPPRE